MKGLKIIAGILGVLVLIAIVAVVLLITFVSPNRFKPLVTEQVKKYTGRDLTIDGDLSWTVFPYLGVKVGHLELTNPSGFKQKIFAEIDSATVGVKFLPLLRSRVESSGISLHGMKLFLVKNAAGKGNWQNVEAVPAVAVQPVTVTVPETSSSKKFSIKLSVAAIDISDATISWLNEQSKQSLDIKNFELHAKEINLTKPFPFSASFNFSGNNPSTEGNVKLTSQISLNLEKQIYTLDDLNLSANVKQGEKKFDIAVKGNAALDMARQKLQLDNLNAEVANLKVLGRVNVTDLSSKPKTMGHLQIQPFDVKTWLKTTGQDVAALQTLKDLSGDVDFTAETSLQSVNLNGAIKVDTVQASKMTLTNVNVHPHLQKGILDLSPITAAFYQGSIQGQAKINLNNAVPQMAIQAKVSNVQAEPLLKDLSESSKLKLKGSGNLDVQVTTSGSSGDDITKNLNGTAKMSFNDGTLEGIDIGYLVDSAYALASRQSLPNNNTDKTQFGSLNASAAIHNGVISNDDLYLNAPRFDTKGNGTINLVSKKIDYHLQTTSKQADKNNVSNMYGLPIPILIAGNLNSPSIRLDTDVLMKAIAKQQVDKAKAEVQQKIQDKIKDQLPDELKKKIPDKAGELINNLLGQ